MKHLPRQIPLACLIFACLAPAAAAQPKSGSPADALPSHIRRLTHFGERADWSADGTRVLFLSKTFGDAMEVEVKTGAIRNLTAHYPHFGYTRAHYLTSGDILLVGPNAYDPKAPAKARWDCFGFLLPKGGAQPAVPLGIRINEGPAVSRRTPTIAWAEWSEPTPENGGNAGSIVYTGEIDTSGPTPKMANVRPVLASADLQQPCTLEPQNFRHPQDEELIVSVYSEVGRKCDVAGVALATRRVIRYTNTQPVYDEPEGIFPDGRSTLVECDSQNLQGPGSIDLWQLQLDGSGDYRRLTYFSEYPSYKASNGAVSDDGRHIAFQLGKSGEAAGVGHGLFLFDLQAVSN